jgi:hypothetical protein
MPEGEKRGRIGGASSNPYHEERKFPEPTMCPRCHLVYRNGRWQTANGENHIKDPNKSHCPACRREIDLLPGGLIYLSGDYLGRHKEEILNIAQNQASSAAAYRPLQRIMWIEEEKGNTEIATTNGHLAMRIGRAIESACKGSLDIKHAHGDQLVRVYWKREE